MSCARVRASCLMVVLVALAALAGCTKAAAPTASPTPPASTSPRPAASSPVPAASASTGLWQPAPDAVPSTGNYVYLQSDAGDLVGDGQTYSYRPGDAKLSVTADGGHLSVVVHGDDDWSGDFQLPAGSYQLVSAEFDDVHGYSSSASTRAGLDWSHNGRSAGLITGWFVVDNVKYVGGALAAVDLRFEQHHAGDAPALHGQIHWKAPKVAPTSVPVPSFSPGAWRPASGATPATGSYVYLVSDPGDYVGAGKTYTYTPGNAEITVKAEGGLISVTVTGDEWWSGDFKIPRTASRAHKRATTATSRDTRSTILSKGGSTGLARAEVQRAHRMVRRGQGHLPGHRPRIPGPALRATQRGRGARSARRDPLEQVEGGGERRHDGHDLRLPWREAQLAGGAQRGVRPRGPPGRPGRSRNPRPGRRPRGGPARARRTRAGGSRGHSESGRVAAKSRL